MAGSGEEAAALLWAMTIVQADNKSAWKEKGRAPSKELAKMTTAPTAAFAHHQPHRSAAAQRAGLAGRAAS